jgi:hypothetical protein
MFSSQIAVFASKSRRRFERVALLLVIVFSLGLAGLSSEPDALLVSLRSLLVDLRNELGISSRIEIRIVERDEALVSVRHSEDQPGCFDLRLEEGFARRLTRQELRAVLAHELGHVWIFTHHPFLQTEELANKIAERVIDARQLAEVYRKVSAYRQQKKATALPIAAGLPAP